MIKVWRFDCKHCLSCFFIVWKRIRCTLDIILDCFIDILKAGQSCLHDAIKCIHWFRKDVTHVSITLVKVPFSYIIYRIQPTSTCRSKWNRRSVIQVDIILIVSSCLVFDLNHSNKKNKTHPVDSLNEVSSRVTLSCDWAHTVLWSVYSKLNPFRSSDLPAL